MTAVHTCLKLQFSNNIFTAAVSEFGENNDTLRDSELMKVFPQEEEKKLESEKKKKGKLLT